MQKSESFLPILHLKVSFHQNPNLEVDKSDLSALFDFFGFSVQGVTRIKKNNFFVSFKSLRRAHLAFTHLNNHFIEDIQARLRLKFCRESDKSSFKERKVTWKANFEIEVPLIDCFNVEKRFFGNSHYNMKRIIYLCERDFLEEDIKIECYGGPDQTSSAKSGGTTAATSNWKSSTCRSSPRTARSSTWPASSSTSWPPTSSSPSRSSTSSILTRNKSMLSHMFKIIKEDQNTTLMHLSSK